MTKPVSHVAQVLGNRTVLKFVVEDRPQDRGKRAHVQADQAALVDDKNLTPKFAAKHNKASTRVDGDVIATSDLFSTN